MLKKKVFAAACTCRPWATFSTSSSSVLVESRGAVHLVGLNRPNRRNAVNRSAAEQLYQAFTHFDSDPSLKVAVLHGIGGTFCAGYDLKDLAMAGEDFTLENFGGGASPMVSSPCMHAQWAYVFPSFPGSHSHGVDQASGGGSEWIRCSWRLGTGTHV